MPGVQGYVEQLAMALVEMQNAQEGAEVSSPGCETCNQFWT